MVGNEPHDRRAEATRWRVFEGGEGVRTLSAERAARLLVDYWLGDAGDEGGSDSGVTGSDVDDWVRVCSPREGWRIYREIARLPASPAERDARSWSLIYPFVRDSIPRIARYVARDAARIPGVNEFVCQWVEYPLLFTEPSFGVIASDVVCREGGIDPASRRAEAARRIESIDPEENPDEWISSAIVASLAGGPSAGVLVDRWRDQTDGDGRLSVLGEWVRSAGAVPGEEIGPLLGVLRDSKLTDEERIDVLRRSGPAMTEQIGDLLRTSSEFNGWFCGQFDRVIIGSRMSDDDDANMRAAVGRILSGDIRFQEKTVRRP